MSNRLACKGTFGHAVVALLHGTGITSAEIRGALREHLVAGPVHAYIDIPARGARMARRVHVPQFAHEALRTWTQQTAVAEGLLFPLNALTGLFCEETLWQAVRFALEQISFGGADMSPRVLRNTCGRRWLLAGKSNDEVSRALGLSSDRTVVRLRATIMRPTVV